MTSLLHIWSSTWGLLRSRYFLHSFAPSIKQWFCFTAEEGNVNIPTGFKPGSLSSKVRWLTYSHGPIRRVHNSVFRIHQDNVSWVCRGKKNCKIAKTVGARINCGPFVKLKLVIKMRCYLELRTSQVLILEAAYGFGGTCNKYESENGIFGAIMSSDWFTSDLLSTEEAFGVPTEQSRVRMTALLIISRWSFEHRAVRACPLANKRGAGTPIRCD